MKFEYDVYKCDSPNRARGSMGELPCTFGKAKCKGCKYYAKIFKDISLKELIQEIQNGRIKYKGEVLRC